MSMRVGSFYHRQDGIRSTTTGWHRPTAGLAAAAAAAGLLVPSLAHVPLVKNWTVSLSATSAAVTAWDDLVTIPATAAVVAPEASTLQAQDFLTGTVADYSAQTWLWGGAYPDIFDAFAGDWTTELDFASTLLLDVTNVAQLVVGSVGDAASIISASGAIARAAGVSVTPGTEASVLLHDIQAEGTLLTSNLANVYTSANTISTTAGIPTSTYAGYEAPAVFATEHMQEQINNAINAILPDLTPSEEYNYLLTDPLYNLLTSEYALNDTLVATEVAMEGGQNGLLTGDNAAFAITDLTLFNNAQYVVDFFSTAATLAQLLG